jgi:DNA replication protein DnaC
LAAGDDELGHIPIDKQEAVSIIQLVIQRYERGTTILLSNLAFQDWLKTYNDNTIAPQSSTGSCTTAMCSKAGEKAIG